jgi:YD repeat-containing protein
MIKFLERHTTLISWLSGLGIPMALVFASWLITNGMESAKLESEYVRIALGILSKEHLQSDKGEEPKAPTEDEMALRRWAVRLLNRKSPEKFSAEEQQAILNSKRSPFALNLEYHYDATGLLRRITDPRGTISTMEYDDLGRIKSRTDRIPATTSTPPPK